jgi:glycosyltransferase involved in cell wall biosynthesis
MRVAFIIPSLANKGPVLVVKELVDNLIKSGATCSVYYFDSISEVDMACATKQIRLSDKIDFARYDVIHCHLFRPDAWGFRWSFTKGVRKKLVSTIHNYFKDDLSFSYSRYKAAVGAFLWRLYWSRFSRLVVLTYSASKYYADYVSPRKINVVYNGRNVIPEDIDEQDKAVFLEIRNRGQKILGTIASFNARKGLEQVIKFLPDNPEFSFVVIGDGPEKNNLINLARHLRVEDRVRFMGPRINGYRYNQYFDVFMIPSRAEGVPLALLEAAALKVPIVCSDIDVFKEVFAEDEVFFFELDNLHSLRDALNKWRENGLEFRTRAYEKYLSCYTSSAMTANYMKIYTEIKNSHSNT